MSMEVLAVLPTASPIDAHAWEMALLKLGLPWRFQIGANPGFARGFCPMRAGKVTSGIEIHDDDGQQILGANAGDLSRVLAFRWSGDPLEYACALSAAAALAEAFGAEIHNPADHPTRIDPAKLTPMAAKATTAALEQNRGALSVAKVVRAVSQMPDMGWRYVVAGRVICRTIEGPYLQGIFVDRRSMPGSYRMYAIQQPWFTVTSDLMLNHTFDFAWLEGGLERITEGVRVVLAHDEGARLCVTAGPFDPMVQDGRLGSDHENALPNMWVERAIMRALSGDTATALPTLKRAAEPFAQEAKARLKIRPVRLPKIKLGQGPSAGGSNIPP